MDSTAFIDPDKPPVGYTDFLNSLSVTEQSRTNLLAFYQSWTKRILALQAATLKGIYTFEPGDAARVRETLDLTLSGNKVVLATNASGKRSI